MNRKWILEKFVLSVKFLLTGWILTMVSISLSVLYDHDSIAIRTMWCVGFAMMLISSLILRKPTMNRKWILESTKFGEFHFVWDSGNNQLTLHDRQLDEAMKIAQEFGYRPVSWIRPSTWGNECVAYDAQVSDAGEPGTFRYSVPAAQQKRILNSGK